jgi:hypothetical protein
VYETSFTPLVRGLLEDVYLDRSHFLRDHMARPTLSMTSTAGGGLSFHRHQASWLTLLSGRKLWCFSSSHNPPRTAHRRTFIDLIIQDPAITVCVQQPGELVYVPKGWWHATYSFPDDSSQDSCAIGIGGSGESPGLHYYVTMGDLDGLKRSAKELSDASDGKLSELDVLRSSVESSGKTLLHVAASTGQLETLTWLLEKGLAVDTKDLLRADALFWAVRLNQADCARVLLERGADPKAPTSLGESAFDNAKRKKKSTLINLILQHSPILGK